MGKFHYKYTTNTMRLQNWDYGWDGIYFVTICTHNREPFFGKISNPLFITFIKEFPTRSNIGSC